MWYTFSYTHPGGPEGGRGGAPMFTDRLVTIVGFVILLLGLVVIAYQNVRIAAIAAELGALIIKTH